MGTLKNWQKENSNFIKLGNGESFTGTYMGYTFMMGQDGKEKPCFKFRDENGSTKTLQSMSGSLIDAFDEEHGTYKKGDKVKLTRHGLDKETKYIVSGKEIQIGNLHADEETPF